MKTKRTKLDILPRRVHSVVMWGLLILLLYSSYYCFWHFPLLVHTKHGAALAFCVVLFTLFVFGCLFVWLLYWIEYIGF